MPTYNAGAVSDTAIAYQKPITLQQGRGLRDNPLAIAEGAAGAPRISGKAMASVARGGLEILNVTAADTFSSEIGMQRVNGNLTNNTSVNTIAASYTCVTYTGTMRFKASHSNTGVGASELSFFKNGLLVQSWTTPSSADRVIDVAIAPGDTFSWQHRSVGSNTSAVSKISTTASDGYFEVIPLMKYSEA